MADGKLRVMCVTERDRDGDVMKSHLGCGADGSTEGWSMSVEVVDVRFGSMAA